MIINLLLPVFTAFVSAEITSHAMVYLKKLSYYRLGQALRAAGG